MGKWRLAKVSSSVLRLRQIVKNNGIHSSASGLECKDLRRRDAACGVSLADNEKCRPRRYFYGKTLRPKGLCCDLLQASGCLSGPHGFFNG